MRTRVGLHVEPRLRSRTRIGHLAVQVLIVLLFGCLVGAKIYFYVYPQSLTSSSLGRSISRATHNTSSYIHNLPFLNSCSAGTRMYEVSGGFDPALRQPLASMTRSTRPIRWWVRAGKLYTSTDQGTVAAANDLMRNVWDVPRYSSAKLSATPTWDEDPYSDNYWRFEFYSLRPTLNLLYAYRTTDNVKYANKLINLDLGFIAAEPHSKRAWVDPHAVAFRSMSLVDTWWKLRQAHELPQAAGAKILQELDRLGQFLADPNHDQAGNNRQPE